jgi:multiple sugar transport system substrate-binding protein
MDVPFVPEFAAAGWTIPVEDLLPAEERQAFFPGTIEGATYEGQLFAVPWYNNGPGLFYRKDLLEQAGLQPPKTYDELRDQAKQLQTPEMAGFVAQLSQTEGGFITFLEYLWGHGGDLVDAEMRPIVAEGEAGTQALQRLVDFVYADKIMPESAVTMMMGADAQNVFIEGRAVFLRMWMTAAQQMDADGSAVAGLWDVTTLPSATGDQPGPGCLGTWNLGISMFSQHPEEAAEAIRFLTSLEQQTQRYLGNGNLPARSAVFDNAEIQAKYPYVPVLRTAFEALKPRPVTPYYGQMSAEALQPNFAAAMTRQKEPAQAVADMAAGMEAVLAQ